MLATLKLFGQESLLKLHMNKVIKDLENVSLLLCPDEIDSDEAKVKVRLIFIFIHHKDGKQ